MLDAFRLPAGSASTVLAAECVAIGWRGVRGGGTAALGGDLVVMDGRLDNRDELGADPDESDAHVVARLARAEGMEAAARRIMGDYAIAWYDAREDVLWLVRDRLGVKPLYFAEAGGALSFASQPCALFARGVGRVPAPDFIARFAGSHYRVFDNDRSASPYTGIHQLPAGHLLTARRSGSEVREYWAIQPSAEETATDTALAEEYRERLMHAVRRRLSPTSRQAFTLSGGLDSSSVLACAAQMSGRSQPAYSTVYRDRTFDESEEIRPMLHGLADPWHPVPVEAPDVPAVVSRMVQLHDEPVATATWLSHYQLCQSVSRDAFAILFGGLGGDELNAGEYEYFFFHFADLKRTADPTLAHEIDSWAGHHDHPLYPKGRAEAAAALRRLVDPDVPGRCLPDRARMLRYAPALAPEYRQLLEAFEPAMDVPFESYLKNRTAQDLFRETTPCCLRAQDRHGTAFGIEHRMPFLDHRLLEWMFRVPGRLKIRDGVTKRLLRDAMTGILPEETRTRVKKVGWNAPAHEWFAGAGRDVLMDIVRSQRFRERGIYDLAETERLIAEHDHIVRSGAVAENHMMFLWQLVNLDAWLA
ncbi:MAG: asparagine synthetase B [Vicinamibacterales bacterium]